MLITAAFPAAAIDHDHLIHAVAPQIHQPPPDGRLLINDGVSDNYAHKISTHPRIGVVGVAAWPIRRASKRSVPRRTVAAGTAQ